MPDKTAASTKSALDTSGRPRRRSLRPPVPLLLTDNGAEFSDCAAIRRSALDPAARRCSIYYCDVRQSQQKGGCERNHVEVRKVCPRAAGWLQTGWAGRNCAVLMSHLNSESPGRPWAACAIDMLLAALAPTGAELLDALGVEEGAARSSTHDGRGGGGGPQAPRRGELCQDFGQNSPLLF